MAAGAMRQPYRGCDRKREAMGYRVLVVDDSKLARMAVAKALNALHRTGRGSRRPMPTRRWRWRRRTRSTSRSSTSTCRAATACELAAELLALKPGMPLAVISANHQVEVVTRAREVGAAFLQKPLTEKALAEFLANATKRLASTPVDDHGPHASSSSMPSRKWSISASIVPPRACARWSASRCSLVRAEGHAGESRPGDRHWAKTRSASWSASTRSSRARSRAGRC